MSGAFQSLAVAKLNDAILAQQGSADRGTLSDAASPVLEVSPAFELQAHEVLQRKFSQDRPIVLKDHRLSLTGGFWAKVVKREGFRPFVIVMHREPSEIVAHLCESDGLDTDAALAHWRTYARSALEIAFLHAHAIVSYSELLESTRAVLERLHAPEPAQGWGEFEKSASAFLSTPVHQRPIALAVLSLGDEDNSLRVQLEQLSMAKPVFPTPMTQDQETPGAPSVNWLLISGAPRSGTSLLRALVDDHPKASILQEFGLTRFVRGLGALVGRPPIVHPPWAPFAGNNTALERAAAFYEEREAAGGAGSHGDLAAVPFDALAQGLFTALKTTPPFVIGDKMPMRGEWEDIDCLQQRLPGLRLLIVLRNPLAVIHSSMIRRARQAMGGDVWPVTSVHEAAEEWWLAWKRAAELAERFGAAIHFVKYESLCEDVEGVMQGVWDWLDLPPHASATLVRRLPTSIDALSVEENGVVDALLGDVVEAWDAEPDPRRLLERFSNVPRPYVPGRRLEAASEEAQAVFVEGFSWRESWGRWTDGERAVIRLRHGLASGHGLLELQVARAFVPQNSACDVVVRVDGRFLKLFSLGQEPARLALICPLRASSGLLEVELLVLNPKTDLDDPPDERRLGIGIESVALRVLP